MSLIKNNFVWFMLKSTDIELYELIINKTYKNITLKKLNSINKTF